MELCKDFSKIRPLLKLQDGNKITGMELYNIPEYPEERFECIRTGISSKIHHSSLQPLYWRVLEYIKTLKQLQKMDCWYTYGVGYIYECPTDISVVDQFSMNDPLVVDKTQTEFFIQRKNFSRPVVSLRDFFKSHEHNIRADEFKKLVLDRLKQMNVDDNIRSCHVTIDTVVVHKTKGLCFTDFTQSWRQLDASTPQYIDFFTLWMSLEIEILKDSISPFHRKTLTEYLGTEEKHVVKSNRSRQIRVLNQIFTNYLSQLIKNDFTVVQLIKIRDSIPILQDFRQVVKLIDSFEVKAFL